MSLSTIQSSHRETDAIKSHTMPYKAEATPPNRPPECPNHTANLTVACPNGSHDHPIVMVCVMSIVTNSYSYYSYHPHEHGVFCLGSVDGSTLPSLPY